MSNFVCNFRVYCTTDNKYVTVWAKEPPTVCPENNAHSINATLTTVIEKIEDTTVTIKEETTPTGGRFKVDMFKIVAPQNTTTEQDFSFDYPVNIINARLITEAAHQGDILSWAVSPDTVVGTITSDYVAETGWVSQNYVVDNLVWYKDSDDIYGRNYKCILNTVSNENPKNKTYWTKQNTVIDVSSTVTSAVQKGFAINLTNGTTVDNIGYIIDVDSVGGTITVNGAPENSYNDSTPTYVRMSVMYMDNIEIGPPMNYSIGGNKIGTSYVPTGTVVRSTYVNKSTDTDKKLIAYIEYLY
jgi:hypothetical protein